MQEFSGIDTVVFYSTTIFGFAGFDQTILATASVGGAAPIENHDIITASNFVLP
jgi:hypothetical protein